MQKTVNQQGRNGCRSAWACEGEGVWVPPSSSTHGLDRAHYAWNMGVGRLGRVEGKGFSGLPLSLYRTAWTALYARNSTYIPTNMEYATPNGYNYRYINNTNMPLQTATTISTTSIIPGYQQNTKRRNDNTTHEKGGITTKHGQ